MAESVCEVERNRNKKTRLMSENFELNDVNSEKVNVNNDLNNLNNIFYLNNLEKNCFSKYDGVNRASEFCPHVDEYKGICPQNDENCRKKRCSDRYDSSESSDSGIAVSSSASSGTSDITDPGSPFSTSSDDSSSSPGKCKESKRCKSEEKSPTWQQANGRCRSEETTWTETWEGKQQSDKTDHNFITPETDFKMAPNVPSASSPCEIWTSITENNTASETAHFNRFNKTQSEAISNKRLKIDVKESVAPLNINNNIVVNVPSPISENDEASNKRKSDNCEGAKVKARRSSSEKGCNGDVASSNNNVTDTVKVNKNGVKTCEKSTGCVAKPKQDRNRHQGKITEYFKSQIKPLVGVKRDFNYLKKDVFQNVNKKADNSKTLAVVSNKLEEPSAKKVKSELDKPEVPVFVKPSPKPLHFMPLSEPTRHLPLTKTPDFLLKKTSETKTLFNKILQNHKNRKLAETYLKSRTSCLKPKENPEVLKLSHKPYESSTRNTEMPIKSTKIEELSSNLEDKVQNKELDSNNLLNIDSNKVNNDLVNCQVVISNCSDQIECESSKSPILSAPKTIRFPANCHNGKDRHMTTRETVCCRWDACSVQFDSASGLLEHLQTAHVLTQVSGEKFVCLWVGCKVFDQKSCSRSWLERHVLSHAGNKPYRCIVDGCGQGFSSQAILERHVNSHFAGDVKKALDNPIAHKLFRRNGKKLRYRRQPWSARMFDYFDAGIMESLEHRLVKLTKSRTAGDVADTPGKALALTSQVVARRMTDNGTQQFLLRWYPLNVVEDEWVYEKDVIRKKTVSIPSLSPSSSSSLCEALELTSNSRTSRGSSRRKNKRPNPKKEEEAEAEPMEEPLPEPEEPIPDETNDLEIEESEEPELPPPKKVPDKASPKLKPRKKKKKTNADSSSTNPLPASVPILDSSNDGSLSTEKTVSLKPADEETTKMSPEEMSVVPVCPTTEEILPNGIIVDNSKLIAPVKTEMILSSPVKLVTSQFVEQPYLQTVMPVQMPVTYQIPIVKLSQPPGMFFPQMSNYIIPPSPAVFPPSPVTPFRNGFQLSAGTIQIQTSTTTLHQTASNFVQSTNASGFQILQSPGALQQSILTAFQNSGVSNFNLKSPTLRLLNCQPLILNGSKPMSNINVTLANVSTMTNGHTSALTMPTVTALPIESNKTNNRKTISPTKKIIKQKLNILPKPTSTQKTGVTEGGKSKKQCLQPCGPTTRAAT